MNLSLSNKVIIVTGATRGIGWAIAKEVHRAGAKVVLHGSKGQELKERVKQLGERATDISADLTDSNSPDLIVKVAMQKFGKIDGLVNNAGIFPRNAIDTASLEDFEKIMAVNTRAPLFLCQAVVKQFRIQKSAGAIVNIGSINAYCGQTDLLIYSMSKGALQTMTRNLGDALGKDNIRVNQINVGWTASETEHQTQLREGRPENWQSLVPLAFAPRGSILKPEEIAPHVVFWLSEASYPVNGQVYELEQYPVIGRNKISS